MEASNVLVTGGAGFIGSHVAQELIDAGYNVIVLDDLSGGFKQNIPKKAHFQIGSILDEQLINELFQKYQFKYVFHLAAYAAEGLSHFIRRYNYENNVIGSINLINAAVNHKVERFVFTSSIAVYGAQQTPFSEGLTPQPEDPYGIAKYSVELDLKAAFEQFGLKYTIFRPHNVYGVRQNLSDPYRNVVGIFMRQLLTKEQLTVYGDGEQTRAFTHINDIQTIIAGCINNPRSINQVYNIGNTRSTSINQLAQLLLDVSKQSNEVKYLPARSEVTHAASNHNKALEDFDPEHSTDLEQGIVEVWNWANTLKLKPPKSFEGIEIRKNLPTNWQ